MAMETVYASSRRSPPGAGAEGKVTELRDVTEEYPKRCRMHASDAGRLREDTRRLEAELSYRLTQIKGAVRRAPRPHAHPAARMDGGGAEPARAALAAYRRDLSEPLSAYRRYKAGAVRISRRWAGQPAEEAVADVAVPGYSVRDRELGESADVPPLDDGPPLTAESCVEAYLEQLFSRHGAIATWTSTSARLSRTCRISSPGEETPRPPPTGARRPRRVRVRSRPSAFAPAPPAGGCARDKRGTLFRQPWVTSVTRSRRLPCIPVVKTAWCVNGSDPGSRTFKREPSNGNNLHCA
ncbi:uncharacterized protein LOC114910441 [Scleropages formosus]|uniref:uncharacterized protein LOC114910441 n=1 Tax=Scleropages formosus TaxID=113540 RepID=UPI0010FA6878|nr:uncharacterized protein LOC114910441 [Scleropages formosus]